MVNQIARILTIKSTYMNLIKQLAKEAKKKGICEDWHLRLKVTDSVEELIDMYIKGIDFCLANNYPSNDFLRKNYKGKIEHRGIYIDDQFNLKNSRFLVSLGNCSGGIEVNGYNVSEVFVKDESSVTIIAKESAFVMVDIFDHASVSVIAHDSARVCINRYGGGVKQEELNNSSIKIREMNKKTY